QWANCPTMYSSPRWQWLSMAHRLLCVPVGTNSAASNPSSAAIFSCSALTLGSSPNTSSPRGAAAMALRMATVGCVTVSLRKSTIGVIVNSFRSQEDLGPRINLLQIRLDGSYFTAFSVNRTTINLQNRQYLI